MGQGSPGIGSRRKRIFEGGSETSTDRTLLRLLQVSGAAGLPRDPVMRRTCGGSHPRVFPTPGAPKGGHIHTEMQGAGSAMPTLKNRWEACDKGGISMPFDSASGIADNRSLPSFLLFVSDTSE